MVSSKKKRGRKQRKAVVIDIVELVKKGDRYTTHKILDTTNHIMSDNLCGVLHAVFGLLQRCEDETFDKVMADVGGDLNSPSTWIHVLIKASAKEPDCKMMIAQNIVSLVTTMSNDTERLFFKSSKHWKDSIGLFVELMSKITGKQTIDAILQHDGLHRSFVQWGFWGKEHRPDIVKMIGAPTCATIASLGVKLCCWIFDYADRLPEDGKIILESIVTTPIVSKSYNPSCTVSFVVGWIRRMKAEGCDQKDLRRLETLSVKADCVDKDVITEVVDFGLNYTSDYDMAFRVANISNNMILEETNLSNQHVRSENKYILSGVCIQSDTRIAWAIRAGLIEMCLNFIEHFGGPSFERMFTDYSFYHCIHDVLKSAYYVQLHTKSSKAIRHIRQQIEEKLVPLEGNITITNNTKCKKLLDMVRCILDTNGAYCCWCNKSLGRKERKQCNGCHHITYCSKSCQKEDWLNGGHSLSCNKLYTTEHAGQYQGRITCMPESERSAAKLKELEINITMVQLKLFLDHSKTILDQASSLGIPLYDCVVRFDLRLYPLTVTTVNYAEYVVSEVRKGFEDSRSRENITCAYFSGFYHAAANGGTMQQLRMQRFFPHEWLVNHSSSPKQNS